MESHVMMKNYQLETNGPFIELSHKTLNTRRKKGFKEVENNYKCKTFLQRYFS